MRDVVKNMDGMWSGKTKAGDEVFVDGPYASAQSAQESAKTLSAVNHAEAGGLYQVSGPLRADIGSEVAAIAGCLRDRAGT
jgi:hypothetical protein